MEYNCLYRMIGVCRNCKPDYDPTHHPNNLDCPRYRPVGMLEVIVKPKVLNTSIISNDYGRAENPRQEGD